MCIGINECEQTEKKAHNFLYIFFGPKLWDGENVCIYFLNSYFLFFQTYFHPIIFITF